MYTGATKIYIHAMMQYYSIKHWTIYDTVIIMSMCQCNVIMVITVSIKPEDFWGEGKLKLGRGGESQCTPLPPLYVTLRMGDPNH